MLPHKFSYTVYMQVLTEAWEVCLDDLELELQVDEGGVLNI